MRHHVRVLGVPVRFDPTFLILIAVFGYLFFLSGDDPHGAEMFVIWIPLVTLAVLVHELGHAFVGRAFGLTPFILLHGMGGLTVFGAREHRELSHGRRILISLAGPFAGFGVGAVAFFVERYGGFVPESIPQRTLNIAWLITLVWGAVNLVPILPLDGGHVVATAFERFFGFRGRRYARVLSILLCLAFAALSLALWEEWFLAAFAAILAVQNYRTYRIEKRWEESDPLKDVLERGYEALAAENLALARKVADAARDRAVTDDAKARIAHLEAWTALLSNEPIEARQKLEEAAPSGDRDAYLEGRVLLATGDASAALEPLAEALEDRSAGEVADALAEAIRVTGNMGPLRRLLRVDARIERTGVDPLRRVARALPDREAAEVYARLFEYGGDPLDAHAAACRRAAHQPEEAFAALRSALDAGLDPARLDADELAVLDPARLETLRGAR